MLGVRVVSGDIEQTGLPEGIQEIFRLDGQRAVVTGAVSGLGSAIALGFACFGAEVACLDIDQDGHTRPKRRYRV